MPTMQRENRGPTNWQNSEARTSAPLENPHTARLPSFAKKSRRFIGVQTLRRTQCAPHHSTHEFDHCKLSEIADARKAVRQGPEPAPLNCVSKQFSSKASR